MAMPLPNEDSTPAPEPGSILEQFLTLDTLPGFRAELVDGEIVVTPPAQNDHETNASEIQEQVYVHRPGVFKISANTGLITPTGRLVPDLTIAYKGSLTGTELWNLPVGVEFVVEVTSPTTARRDREQKRRGYALAGIPLYLLVDRKKETVTLFGEPDHEDYQVNLTYPFGHKVPLPAPFDFDLDTSDLV